MFVPLLELPSCKGDLLDNVLQFILNQMMYGDELLKFFTSFIAINIKRDSHQRCILRNLTPFFQKIIPLADECQDAWNIVAYIFHRFPTKSIKSEYFKLMNFDLLSYILLKTCSTLRKIKKSVHILVLQQNHNIFCNEILPCRGALMWCGQNFFSNFFPGTNFDVNYA